MQLRSRVQMKRFEDVVAGELVLFAEGGASVRGIVSERDAQRPNRLDVFTLDPTDRDAAFIVRPITGNYVASFGSDWVLDVVDSGSSYVRDGNPGPGFVLIRANGPGIIGEAHMGYAPVFDLTANTQHVLQPESVIAIEHWRILSHGQIDVGGRPEPLFEWQVAN